MSGEDFLLKWNDHHTLFFAGAEQLCESEEYTDVTLAAGSKFFPAHKLVLSICSPYFQKLFRRLGAEKSVIFLKDVDPKHLELLLQYMYKGEIKVEENELVTVLNTAQSLEIKGLTDSTDSGSSKSSEPSKPTPYRAPAPKRPSPIPQPSTQFERKKPKVNPNDALYKLSNVHVSPAVEQPSSSSTQRVSHSSLPPSQEPVVSVKQEVAPVTIDLDQPQDNAMQGYDDGMGQEMAYSDTTVATGYEGEEGYEGDEYYQDGGLMQGTDQDDREFWAHQNSSTVCPFCHKDFQHLSTLKQHLPVHTGEKKYECDSCNKRFTQSSSLYKHIKAQTCIRNMSRS